MNIDVSPLGSNGGGIGSAFSSFFSQIKSRDFSILKWVLLGLLILTPFVILYLFISGKIVAKPNMFGLDYGVKFILGDFGAGKTKNIFEGAYLWKKDNPDGILIGNIPYDFVDIKYDSKDDFDILMLDLVQYIRETNNIDFLKKNKEFPPIKFIGDEIHEYLMSRDFKNLQKEVVLILTQCRKRSISFEFISQRLSQVDVFLRRLSFIFQEYKLIGDKNGFARLGLRHQYIKECVDPDCNNIDDEQGFEILEHSILLPDSIALKLDKGLKTYYEQSYLTKYVIGGKDVYCDEDDKLKYSKHELIHSHRYYELKALIDQKQDNINKQLLEDSQKNKWFLKNIFTLKPDSEVDKKIIKQQKEMIDKMMKYVPEDELSNFSFDNINDNGNV